MRRLTLPNNSFLAFLDYERETQTLYATIRKTGKQYLYKGFKLDDFNKLLGAQNKGSFFALNINGKYECEFCCYVPLAEIERALLPTKSFSKYLSK